MGLDWKEMRQYFSRVVYKCKSKEKLRPVFFLETWNAWNNSRSRVATHTQQVVGLI